MASQTQTVQRKPVQVREPPNIILVSDALESSGIVLGPSPARPSSRHQPRDEKTLRPQGLRKRGQNTSSSGSTQSELERDSWRAINTSSAASARSEQSLGILDYYFEPAKSSLEDGNVDPAMKNFDFGLMSKKSSPNTSPVKRPREAQDVLSELTPPRRSRDDLLRITRAPQTKKRRAGHIWSTQDRRRSSLSICCQGGPREAYTAPMQEEDISPTDRKRSFTLSGRRRKDSGASLQDQVSPTDSRFTASSWSKSSSQSRSWSNDTQTDSWITADILRLSAGSSSTKSARPKRKLSSIFRHNSSQKRGREDSFPESTSEPEGVESRPTKLSTRMRALLLCS